MQNTSDRKDRLPENRLKKARRKKVLTIILALVLSLIILFTTAFFIAFRHFYNKTNHVPDNDIAVDTTTFTPEEELPEEAEIVTLAPEEEQSLIEEVTLTVEELDEEELSGVYNLLLIGVDRRDRSWNGNSDAMILITINHEQKKIFMTSFMRDLYANIEGIGVRKLNNAYAVGGGPLLVNTLTSNYGVRIDNYASVDFLDMVQIIDICGGVEIFVRQEEIQYVNGYLDAMNRSQDIYYRESFIPEDSPGGTFNLNGRQALAYSRIRVIGYDFERTERQRRVLQALIKKARTMNVFQLMSLADSVFPLVTHNISSSDTLKLMTDLPSILSYEVVELRIPFGSEYRSQNEILVPLDINDTVTKLRNIIYAKAD